MMKALSLYAGKGGNPECRDEYVPFIDSLLEKPIVEIQRILN
jgi:hypothetical protein